MPPDPSSTRWLTYAESDLAIAYGVDRPGVLAESLCFHAQQAAEKAIKAVLVACGADPPRTHDLEVLLAAIPGHIDTALDVAAVAALTVYSVASRYPGDSEPVDDEEHAAAVEVAESVVVWARHVVTRIADEE